MLAKYRKRKREEPLTRVLAQYRKRKKGKSHSRGVTQYPKHKEEPLTEVLLSTAFRTTDAVEHIRNQ